MTLNAIQRSVILARAGIPPEVLIEPSDGLYKPCESGWLVGDYHRWYFTLLDRLGIRAFAAESGDCDDFADLFAVHARVAHRRSPEGNGTALPIGRFNFARVPSAPIGAAQQRHALVWACTSDLGLIFIEPQQLGKIERLTPAQIASCTRCSD